MRQLLNYFGQKRIPCWFIFDFAQTQVQVYPLQQLPPDILWSTNYSKQNYIKPNLIPQITNIQPIAYTDYKHIFAQVIAEMQAGNTYLLNLTFATAIELNISLLELFYAVQAKFKLYFQNQFVCFSPERFILIENAQIKTFPMKGTIRANLPNAAQLLLNNPKELAEHVMVVDLLRNDLSQVATQVRVQRFRYLEKIPTMRGELLQASSEIVGNLAEDWPQYLGDILYNLLPAGSISGTPKHNTIKLIQQFEPQTRGFFTGIWGYFDGHKLDSAVLIRFIERLPNGKLIYRSGGGITVDSNPQAEYQELLDKIYLPLAT
jgi:para-aminobenzoate synthetase component I